MERSRNPVVPWLLASLCAHAVGACAPPGGEPADEDPSFEPQYTTARLKIGVDGDLRLCQGQIDLWESQIDMLEDQLGFTRDLAWVYVTRDQEALMEACGESPTGRDGCWNGSVAYGRTGSISHELVHAWSMSANRDPLPILREGLAVHM